MANIMLLLLSCFTYLPFYSSRKGETLASRKDFRMNTCTTHACGAFMLELAMSPMQFKQNTQTMEDGNSCPGLNFKLNLSI